MGETMRTAAQDLIERAAKVDPVLAADIRAFAQQREFGLVFEHNRPEQMRLYGKPVVVGDTVQILPPRGKNENDDSRVMWRISKIVGEAAFLELCANTSETKEAALEDLVAVAEYDQPIYAGLKETGRIERGEDKPYQVVINGENYHALESLLFCYSGKVDCIYIDPPYNTGAKDWKYNNDYVGGDDSYRHSKWLAMMERRLKLAKSLLNPKESVLICTIDEKEYLRLGLLLEQTFLGATIQMVSSIINPKGSRRNGEFSRCDEYLFYVLIGNAQIGSIGKTMRDDNETQKPIRWKGLLRSASNSGRRTDRPNLFYPLLFSKKTGAFLSVGEAISKEANRRSVEAPKDACLVWPIGEDGSELTWSLSRETFVKYQSKGYVKFGPWDGKKRVPYHLTSGQVADVEIGEYQILGKDNDGALILERHGVGNVRPLTIWTLKSHSASEHGTGLIKKMLPGRSFPFPKSLYAVEDSIRFFVADKPNALVLDFFSGSGTTLHAVMRLNHQDNGQRRCVCVTNNEVSEDEEKKLTEHNLRKGDSKWDTLGICEHITKPRISSAVTGETPKGEPIKGNYSFTDEFPMADGFLENAIFFDLTYQEPDVVGLGAAYSEIAPLLWMRAGCKGKIVATASESFEFSDAYGILFDYAAAREFVAEAKQHPELVVLYVVTDDESRYANIKKAFPDIDVVRLYESYLRSFKIAAEGALV